MCSKYDIPHSIQIDAATVRLIAVYRVVVDSCPRERQAQCRASSAPLRDLLDAPTAVAACCGFDLCHKYILYLYFVFYAAIGLFVTVQCH
jgi:hypothetical protein